MPPRYPDVLGHYCRYANEASTIELEIKMGRGCAMHQISSGACCRTLYIFLFPNELLAFSNSHTLAAKHQNRHDLTRGQNLQNFHYRAHPNVELISCDLFILPTYRQDRHLPEVKLTSIRLSKTHTALAVRHGLEGGRCENVLQPRK